MKLDKIKFGRLIGMIVHIAQRTLHEDEVEAIDYACQMPDVEQQAVYPKNENVERLMMLMAEGTRKIEAIKEHRAITGMGLKESKDAVERYWPDNAPKWTIKELFFRLNQMPPTQDIAVIKSFLDNL